MSQLILSGILNLVHQLVRNPDHLVGACRRGAVGYHADTESHRPDLLHIRLQTGLYLILYYYVIFMQDYLQSPVHFQLRSLRLWRDCAADDPP